jgi:hypothetical protein
VAFNLDLAFEDKQKMAWGRSLAEDQFSILHRSLGAGIRDPSQFFVS